MNVQPEFDQEVYDRVGEIESRDYNVNNQISFNLRLINLEIFNFDHREQLLGVARTVGVREREAGLNALALHQFLLHPTFQVHPTIGMQAQQAITTFSALPSILLPEWFTFVNRQQPQHQGDIQQQPPQEPPQPPQPPQYKRRNYAKRRNGKSMELLRHKHPKDMRRPPPPPKPFEQSFI